MIAKIVQAGEPVLRRRARDLTPEEILSPAVQGLLELMRATMRDAPGVGLAAPQIGQPLRMAVIEDRPEYQAGVPKEALERRQRVPVPFHVLINPRLTITDASREEFFEGCLSVAGFVAMVPRALAVSVSALNERAE